MTKTERVTPWTLATFEHNGRQYELRGRSNNQGWTVEVFYKGRRIMHYMAIYEIGDDFSARWGSVVDQMMEMAKTEVEERIEPILSELERRNEAP